MNLLAFDLPFVPKQASAQAGQVDAIFFAITVLSALLCVLLFVAITYCLIRYRSKSNADRTMSMAGHNLVEVVWSVIPMLIFIGLFIWGAIVYVEARNPPKNALTVYVVGLQWYWDIEHEEGPHEIGELHVPLNQPVRLVMTSQDVIHDFYVPAFRTKMDVVPGKYTEEWFTPIEPGRFRVFCNQYCGTKHGQMTAWIDVMKPQDYQAWLVGAGANTESIVQTGARLFRAHNCSSCHDDNSQVAAPDLHNIYGRQVPLSDGTFVTADDEYLRDSILTPAAQVVAGYKSIMPVYKGQISEPDIMAIIAYIKSLTPTPSASRPTSNQP
ncbi:MAG TPA: cytochrome c oxidase subunit II [Chthoniobacterales bacterium]|jgi:cytochrome c oxidase subunit 2